jgi:hypothetical protein
MPHRGVPGAGELQRFERDPPHPLPRRDGWEIFGGPGWCLGGRVGFWWGRAGGGRRWLPEGRSGGLAGAVGGAAGAAWRVPARGRFRGWLGIIGPDASDPSTRKESGRKRCAAVTDCHASRFSHNAWSEALSVC